MLETMVLPEIKISNITIKLNDIFRSIGKFSNLCEGSNMVNEYMYHAVIYSV